MTVHAAEERGGAFHRLHHLFVAADGLGGEWMLVGVRNLGKVGEKARGPWGKGGGEYLYSEGNGLQLCAHLIEFLDISVPHPKQRNE